MVFWICESISVAFVVNNLYFWSGRVRIVIVKTFLNSPKNSTVSTFRDIPFNGELKACKLFVRNDVMHVVSLWAKAWLKA